MVLTSFALGQRIHLELTEHGCVQQQDLRDLLGLHPRCIVPSSLPKRSA
ncbi:hypothetical protein [Nocardia sp. CNY236]|nr:hypothetical protein [Nocardia sp. CNY236]